MELPKERRLGGTSLLREQQRQRHGVTYMTGSCKEQTKHVPLCMWQEIGERAAEGELVRPGNRSQPAGIKTKKLYCGVSLLYFFVARG